MQRLNGLCQFLFRARRRYRYNAKLRLIVLIGLTLAGIGDIVSSAIAAPITLGGITFSDELGGVELTDGWGSGTVADPFVLVETITDDGPAVLVVRGLGSPPTSGLRQAPRQVGFALRKIVTNSTARDWHAFELELREQLVQTSSYEDGLSFGQAALAQRSFASDRFARVSLTDEPLDAVVFSEGLIRPGETVTVEIMITDYTPGAAFYLLQRRDGPIAALPGRRTGG